MIRKIVNESYRPLINLYKNAPEAKATININGSLTELLNDLGLNDIIDGFRELAQKGQIEFTGTSKYHAIMPLISEQEAIRQIQINVDTNRYFFGDVYKPRGFFPPEMCYSKDILDPLADMGYEWFVMSGVGCTVQWPVNEIWEVDSDGRRLTVFFRDDLLSNMIGFHNMQGGKPFMEKLRELQSQRNAKDIYVVTAMDAETFGHHIQSWEKLFLMSTYAEIKQQTNLPEEQHRILDMGGKEIKSVTISELLSMFPKKGVTEPKPSSWSTSAQDLANGEPYPLWSAKNNRIQENQWESLKICADTVHKASNVADNDESKKYSEIARLMLDRAEHSCQFWWASKRPWWDPNMIAKGLEDHYLTAVNAYRAIRVSGCPEDVKKEYYHKVVAARAFGSKVIDELFTE